MSDLQICLFFNPYSFHATIFVRNFFRNKYYAVQEDVVYCAHFLFIITILIIMRHLDCRKCVRAQQIYQVILVYLPKLDVLLSKEAVKVSLGYSGLGPLTSGLGAVKAKPRQALVRYKCSLYQKTRPWSATSGLGPLVKVLVHQLRPSIINSGLWPLIKILGR